MSKDFITLSFSPSHKYLSVSWLRPVSSAEYRQGVRIIALCVAKLGAKFVLTDFSNFGIPSVEDLQHAALFLKQALSKASLCRSARILSVDKSQWQAYNMIQDQAEDLPYEVRVFSCKGEAQMWLLKHSLDGENTPKDLIAIPMHQHMPDLSVVRANNKMIIDNETVHAAQHTEAGSGVRFKTDFIEIMTCKQIDVLFVRWLRSVQSKEYRIGIEEAGKVLLKHTIEKVLLNNQRLNVLSINDQNWLANISIDIISKSCLKRLAVISSNDLLQQITDEALDCKVKSANLIFDAHHFFEESEALEWLSLPNEASELKR